MARILFEKIKRNKSHLQGQSLAWAKSAKSVDFAQILIVWQECACLVACSAMVWCSSSVARCAHLRGTIARYALGWHCGKDVLDCVLLDKFLAYNFLVLQSLL